jgi:hypothetical protein
MPNAILVWEPPTNVEYLREALPVRLVSTKVMNAMPAVFPFVWNAPEVAGKRSELVKPVTYATFEGPSAMASPKSAVSPPRYVE